MEKTFWEGLWKTDGEWGCRGVREKTRRRFDMDSIMDPISCRTGGGPTKKYFLLYKTSKGP